MLKKSIILYSVCFTLAAGVAGAGGYLFAPAQKADPISEEAPEVKVAPAQANEDEDTFEGEEFVPQELTPQDKFVQGLTEMKTLRGDARNGRDDKGNRTGINQSNYGFREKDKGT